MMKGKYVIRTIILLVAGYGLYLFLKKADEKVNCKCSKKNSECDNFTIEKYSSKKNDYEENTEIDKMTEEQKCDVTAQQVCFNMVERNKEAEKILQNIHDDMKESKENIEKKKGDIERIMSSLKK